MPNLNLVELEFMVKEIAIKFTDFWPGFDEHNNYFTRLLSTRYKVHISTTPDFLFHSVHGIEHLRYNCIRILFTAENVRPNFFETDYAFSFDYPESSERNFRFPYYGWRVNPDLLVKKDCDIDRIVAEKKKFCNMVVSNASAKERIDFFHKLSKYKKVDSGGKYLNNIGDPVADKISFIKEYKFTLAFENSSYPGYTTEKIAEPMLVNSLPIYWGNPIVEKDFNTKSFINIHDYKSFDEAIERIIEIDNDETLYRSYLSQPYFDDNSVNRFVDQENVLPRLIEIIENGRSYTNISKRLKVVYQPMRKTEKKLEGVRSSIKRRLGIRPKSYRFVP